MDYRDYLKYKNLEIDNIFGNNELSCLNDTQLRDALIYYQRLIIIQSKIDLPSLIGKKKDQIDQTLSNYKKKVEEAEKNYITIQNWIQVLNNFLKNISNLDPREDCPSFKSFIKNVNDIFLIQKGTCTLKEIDDKTKEIIAVKINGNNPEEKLEKLKDILNNAFYAYLFYQKIKGGREIKNFSDLKIDEIVNDENGPEGSKNIPELFNQVKLDDFQKIIMPNAIFVLKDPMSHYNPQKITFHLISLLRNFKSNLYKVNEELGLKKKFVIVVKTSIYYRLYTQICKLESIDNILFIKKNLIKSVKEKIKFFDQFDPKQKTLSAAITDERIVGENKIQAFKRLNYIHSLFSEGNDNYEKLTKFYQAWNILSSIADIPELFSHLCYINGKNNEIKEALTSMYIFDSNKVGKIFKFYNAYQAVFEFVDEIEKWEDFEKSINNVSMSTLNLLSQSLLNIDTSNNGDLNSFREFKRKFENGEYELMKVHISKNAFKIQEGKLFSKNWTVSISTGISLNISDRTFEHKELQRIADDISYDTNPDSLQDQFCKFEKCFEQILTQLKYNQQIHIPTKKYEDKIRVPEFCLEKLQKIYNKCKKKYDDDYKKLNDFLLNEDYLGLHSLTIPKVAAIYFSQINNSKVKKELQETLDFISTLTYEEGRLKQGLLKEWSKDQSGILKGLSKWIEDNICKKVQETKKFDDSGGFEKLNSEHCLVIQLDSNDTPYLLVTLYQNCPCCCSQILISGNETNEECVQAFFRGIEAYEKILKKTNKNDTNFQIFTILNPQNLPDESLKLFKKETYIFTTQRHNFVKLVIIVSKTGKELRGDLKSFLIGNERMKCLHLDSDYDFKKAKQKLKEKFEKRKANIYFSQDDSIHKYSKLLNEEKIKHYYRVNVSSIFSPNKFIKELKDNTTQNELLLLHFAIDGNVSQDFVHYIFQMIYFGMVDDGVSSPYVLSDNTFLLFELSYYQEPVQFKSGEKIEDKPFKKEDMRLKKFPYLDKELYNNVDDQPRNPEKAYRIKEVFEGGVKVTKFFEENRPNQPINIDENKNIINFLKQFDEHCDVPTFLCANFLLEWDLLPDDIKSIFYKSFHLNPHFCEIYEKEDNQKMSGIKGKLELANDDHSLDSILKPFSEIFKSKSWAAIFGFGVQISSFFEFIKGLRDYIQTTFPLLSFTLTEVHRKTLIQMENFYLNKKPILIQEETGSGKTKIIKLFLKLKNIPKNCIYKLVLNPNMTEEDIITWFRSVFFPGLYENLTGNYVEPSHSVFNTINKDLIIFLEDYTATRHQWLLKSIMIDRFFDGVTIPDYVHFFAAGEPFREISQDAIALLDSIKAPFSSDPLDPHHQTEAYIQRNYAYKIYPSPYSMKILLDNEKKPCFSITYPIHKGRINNMDKSKYSNYEIIYSNKIIHDLGMKFDLQFFEDNKINKKETASFIQKEVLELIATLNVLARRLLINSKEIYNDPSFCTLRDASKFCKAMISVYENGLAPLDDGIINKLIEYKEINEPKELNELNKMNSINFKRSFIVAFTLVYILQLPEDNKEHDTNDSFRFRNGFMSMIQKFWSIYSDFPLIMSPIDLDLWTKFLELDETYWTDTFLNCPIHKGNEISKNSVFMENAWISFISVITGLHLNITGLPGTSKSLALNTVFSVLKTIKQRPENIKNLPVVLPRTVMCSEYIKQDAIELVADHLVEYGKSLSNTIMILILEEIGHADLSPYIPLSIMNTIYNGKWKGHKIMVISLSNYKLDSQKMNQSILAIRGEFNTTSLHKTADDLFLLAYNKMNGGAEIDSELRRESSEILNCISKQYYKLKTDFLKKGPTESGIGLRDFYGFAKDIARIKFNSKKNHIEKEEEDKEIILSLYRHFSGWFDEYIYFEKHPNSNLFEGNDEDDSEVYRFLKKLYNEGCIENDKPPSTLEVIRTNLTTVRQFRRHIMIPTIDGSAFYLWDTIMNQNTDLFDTDTNYLFNDNFNGTDDIRWIESDLSRFKENLAKGQNVVFIGVHPAFDGLYDVFNMAYIKDGDQLKTSISFSSGSREVPIQENFKTTIILDYKDYCNLPAPFKNRFDKIPLTFRSYIKGLNDISNDMQKAFEESRAELNVFKEKYWPYPSKQQIESIFVFVHSLSQKIPDITFDTIQDLFIDSALLNIPPSKIFFDEFFSEEKIKYSKSLIRTSIFHSSLRNLINAYHPKKKSIPKSFEEALMSTFYERKGISAILLSDDINSFIKDDTITINKKNYMLFKWDIITLENKNFVDKIKKEIGKQSNVICILSINTPNEKMQMRIWHIMHILDLLRKQEGNFELHTLFLIKPIDDVSLHFPQNVQWPCIYLDDLRGPENFGLKDILTKGPADWIIRGIITLENKNIVDDIQKSKSLSKPVLGLADNKLNENSWLYVKLLKPSLPTNSIIHTTKDLFESDLNRYEKQENGFQCFWEQYPIEKIKRISVEDEKIQKFVEYWQELLSYDWIDQADKVLNGDFISESLFKFFEIQEGQKIKNEKEKQLQRFLLNVIKLFFDNKTGVKEEMKFIVKTELFNIMKNLYRLQCFNSISLKEDWIIMNSKNFLDDLSSEQKLDHNDEFLVKRIIYVIRLRVFRVLCNNLKCKFNELSNELKKIIYNIFSYFGKTEFEFDMMNSQMKLLEPYSSLIEDCKKLAEELNNFYLNPDGNILLGFDVPPNVQIVLPIEDV